MHVPVYCSEPGCKLEASRWYQDGDKTVYVCLAHDDTQEAEGAGCYVLPDGKHAPFAAYCCQADCGKEDVEPCPICH